eukprot:7913491-Alexandrium_andersonii.AAC.1
MSKASYIEFRDADTAKSFLERAGGKNIKFEEGLEFAVTLKPAKTQVNMQRDWALRKAFDM